MVPNTHRFGGASTDSISLDMGEEIYCMKPKPMLSYKITALCMVIRSRGRVRK
jgi:hypothetical protein